MKKGSSKNNNNDTSKPSNAIATATTTAAAAAAAAVDVSNRTEGSNTNNNDISQQHQRTDRSNNGTSSTQPGAFVSSTTTTSTFVVRDVKADLCNYEADILAKQRAGAMRKGQIEPNDVSVKQKGHSNNSNTTTTKPGAYASTPSKVVVMEKDDKVDLNNFEEDILTKQIAAGGAIYRPTNIGQDILAKQKGRSSTSATTTPTGASKPGAYASTTSGMVRQNKDDLNQIEADILAKQTATGTGGGGGGVTIQKPIDPDIRAKQMGRSSNNSTTTAITKPGAYSSTNSGNHVTPRSDLFGVEADILAKQRGGTALRRQETIEQDILAKHTGRSSPSRTINTSTKPGAYNMVISGDRDENVVLSGFETDVMIKQNTARHVQQHIDQEILAKRMGRSSTVDHIAIPGAFPTQSTVTSNEDLVALETDVMIKQNVARHLQQPIDEEILAKRLGRSTTVDHIAIPGAFHGQSMVSYDDADLVGLESDVMEKQNTARHVEKTIEQEIVEKQTRRSFTAQHVAIPGAFSANSVVGNDHEYANSSLKSDIISKQTAAGSTNQIPAAAKQTRHTVDTPVTAEPGAHATMSVGDNIAESGKSRTLLEADILAKQTIGTTRTSAVPAMEHNMEAADIGTVPVDDKVHHDILAKQTAAMSVSRNDADNYVHNSSANMKAYPISLVHDGGPFQSSTYSSDDSLLAEIEELDVSIASKRSNLESTLYNDVHQVENEELNLENLAEPNSRSSATVSPIGRQRKRPNSIVQNRDGIFSQNSLSLDPELVENNVPVVDEEGLAVAFAVDDDVDQTYLPSAIEFDPDAKPPMYRNRRFRLYLLLMISTTMIGVIGAILGLILTKVETPQLIPYRATLGIRENIELVVGKDELVDINSPYRKALEWIMFADPLALTPEDPTFFQRYILAYFYFATSRYEPWTSGCAPSESQRDDCSTKYFLDRPDESEDASATIQGFRWLSRVDECKWTGVSCNKINQTMKLEISGYTRKAGTFPEGLTLLPFLQELTLEFMNIEGSLPVSLWKMNNLYSFSGVGNQITGTISDQMYESRTLQILLLQRNAITGELAKNVSNMHVLKKINLSRNKLSGTIPSEIGELINIDSLELSNGNFTGTLPSSFGRLRYISTLCINQNKLTGTIPDIFDNYRKIHTIYFDNNLLTGPIPESIYNDNTFLESLHLNDNSLTGTVSNKIAKTVFLKSFLVQNNQMTGELPDRYGKSLLTNIEVQGNHFNGTVPVQLCGLVASGQVKELVLDCLEETSGTNISAPEIVCPPGCCTMCCNVDGDSCIDMKT